MTEISILSKRQRAITDPLLRPNSKSSSLDSMHSIALELSSEISTEESTCQSNRSTRSISSTPLSSATSQGLTPLPTLSAPKALMENVKKSDENKTTKVRAPLFDDEKDNENLTCIEEFLKESTKTKDTKKSVKSTTASPLISNWAIDKSSLGIAQEECPICLDEIQVSDRSYLPCSHYFHQECVSQCMNVIITNGCPLCRIPILSEEDRLTEELVKRLSMEESD
eukprot:TRINITY_DN9586_c0_g1_i1.p1 TRINITY_DN9586_c0_g1~~TRINITY_DN9586_c0_g1_i1.p1  ORF type:complete len:225 (+),score=68.39 TRINITY_DN9586_c0_g1_i1:247-921(+)